MCTYPSIEPSKTTQNKLFMKKSDSVVVYFIVVHKAFIILFFMSMQNLHQKDQSNVCVW